MELTELRPGLWRPTAFHPEWRQDVRSVAYEGADALVLIDPLVDRVDKQPVVLVTVFWHTRSADVLARRNGALVPGDVLLGSDDGGLRLCPQSWLPAGTTRHRLAGSLRPLLELPVSHVLVSHGRPVLRNGRAALERALAG